MICWILLVSALIVNDVILLCLMKRQLKNMRKIELLIDSTNQEALKTRIELIDFHLACNAIAEKKL